MGRFEPHPARRPAIVAGASSGIGAATAVELAAHGFPVALGARRVEKCREIVETIRVDGGEAVALPLDVTDPDSVKEFVHQATEQLGEIEVLVAGAGDTHFGRLHEIDTATFESQVQIHLIGANRLATAVLPGIYGYHPDFAKIDWKAVQWFKSGKAWTPDPAKSLADNGLVHKDAIRFRTPGLEGIKGSHA